MSKRILITGGCGFIGSWLVDRFINPLPPLTLQGLNPQIKDAYQRCLGDDASEYTIHVLDNLSTGTIKNISPISDNVIFTQADVRDAEFVDKAVEQCDMCYHLAASVGVQNILNNQVDMLSTNIEGTENVIKSCLKHNKLLILASTSEIYGDSGKNDILVETDDPCLGNPQVARWSYAYSKIADECLASAYHRELGLRVIICRFFNTIGPRQTGEYGMVLPKFISSAKAGEQITVFGDGKQSRCFCDVDDVTLRLRLFPYLEGHKFSTENEFSYPCWSGDPIGEVFNVGNIKGYTTINDLAQNIRAWTKSDSVIVHMKYDEVKRIYGAGFVDIKDRRPNTNKIDSLFPQIPYNNIKHLIKEMCK